MTLPINFLYLGGDKCGSTWIYHILSRHPSVTLAHAKELFYFDRFYDKGAEWYVKQFPADPTGIRIGEICHDYLYSEEALKRIAKDMPDDSRFLITVRDPVDRTVSHYKYLRKIGRTDVGLAQALDEQPQIIEHSMFGKYVQMAQMHLGADRVHVLPFENLKRDSTGFGRSLSDALGIPFDPGLPYSDRVLEAQAARSPGLVRILRNAGWLMRALGLPRVVSAVKSNPLVSTLLFSDKKTPDVTAALTDDIRTRLNTLFAADQALLMSLVPDLERQRP